MLKVSIKKMATMPRPSGGPLSRPPAVPSSC
nr:MAG TPA: hypothetical protein [Caudoviricetes sp.]